MDRSRIWANPRLLGSFLLVGLWLAIVLGAATMTVTVEKNQLFAQLTGQPRWEIFAKSQNTFFWKVVQAEVTFVKGKNGKIEKAHHKQGGREFDAPRIE